MKYLRQVAALEDKFRLFLILGLALFVLVLSMTDAASHNNPDHHKDQQHADNTRGH